MSVKDIMPDEWRIKFTPHAEYAAQEDRRALNKLIEGTITERECLNTIEYNNGFNKDTLTHDQLIANLIWLGYFNAYKSNHKLSVQDMIIEAYFNERRAELRDKCI